MIFQEPMTSLNPLHKIGRQVTELLVLNNVLDKGSASEKVRELFDLVGLDDSIRVDAYPHELSGGQRQRVMIAMALVSQPKLLIADDPTRGMEPTTKTQILKLFTRLNQTRSLSILFVSHDLLAIASMSHSMTVLYAGQTVESGRMKHIKKRPLHPYTKALLDSAPSFRKDLPPKSLLPTLGGSIPTLQHLPIGCRLGPRCPRAQRACVQTPAVRKIHDHNYSCHFPLHMEKL